MTSRLVDVPQLEEYEESLANTGAIDAAFQRQWVKLEDVAWVLEPAKLYKGPQPSWEKHEMLMESEEGRQLHLQFDRLKQLADYYTMQIRWAGLRVRAGGVVCV